MKRARIVAWALLVLWASSGLAQDLEAFAKNVTVHRLDNGLTFVLVERHTAPTVAFHTYVDTGSVDEVAGITGMAHLFEHLAFKGTKTVGTSNYEAEQAIYEKMDEIYELKKRLERNPEAQPEELARVRAEWAALSEEVKTHIVEGEFDKALEQAGVQGMNATTGSDATQYFFSLPSNRIELWCNLESDRFANPVIREFFKERDVVKEERRMRIDSNPIGRMIEQMLGVAFHAHPYGYPGIGYMSDLDTVTRREAATFFEKHYNASTITIAVVGDFETGSLIPMLERYFSRIPGGTKPDPVETIEPDQLGLKRIEIEDRSQPLIALGFHKPSALHADEPIYDALSDIMGGGRSSRLYRELVTEQQLAIDVGAFTGFPGNKYPNLFVVYAMVAQGKTTAEVEAAIWDVLADLKAEPVSDTELQGVVTRVRAGLVRGMGSNAGLARTLVTYQAMTGDWRDAFNHLDKLKLVSGEDVQRVAGLCFQRKNCTVGAVVPPAEED